MCCGQLRWQEPGRVLRILCQLRPPQPASDGLTSETFRLRHKDVWREPRLHQERPLSHACLRLRRTVLRRGLAWPGIGSFLYHLPNTFYTEKFNEELFTDFVSFVQHFLHRALYNWINSLLYLIPPFKVVFITMTKIFWLWHKTCSFFSKCQSLYL